MITVSQAHPFVLRVGARGEFVADERTADEHEDIDALPVREQAAIYCSIMASRRGGRGYDYVSNYDVIGSGDPVWNVTATAARAIEREFGPSYLRGISDEETWAEVEAQLRAGHPRSK